MSVPLFICNYPPLFA